MSIIFLCLFLFHQHSTIASSLSSQLSSDTATYTRAIRSDASLEFSGRSIWDIVWSCLATTFAVTWVSVHPNVPWLEETSLSVLKRRIFLMCLALLAPEVMIMWAFKQWRGAVVIKETFNQTFPKAGRPWTMTHAHFIQMGGFKLRTSRREDNSRGHDYGYRLLAEGRIELPDDISEEEIADRSKSDALSKGVAILQITWFIVQLVARTRQHLTVTEIELTTAALAGLNAIMYLFWWSKPFDVRCPIIIRKQESERRLPEKDVQFTPEDFSLQAYLVKAARDIFLSKRRQPHRSTIASSRRSLFDFTLWRNLNSNRLSVFYRSIAWVRTSCRSFVYLPYLLMYLPMDVIFDPIRGVNLFSFQDARDKMHSKPALQFLFNENDMPWVMGMMFYSERANARPLLYFSAMAGAVFGSIHCAAWDYHFPTPVEQILWRMASLLIVGVCLSIIPGVLLYNAVYMRWWHARLPWRMFMRDENRRAVLKHKAWSAAKKFLETAPAIVYPIARLFLLTLSLLSLRDLQNSAFETVTWTKFIPHM